jgi:MYXO-CTERM domain-containing protein
MKITMRKTFLAALVGALSASVAWLSEGEAAQIFTSDCSDGAVAKSSFNPGDAVCVSGDADVVPPSSFCAEADFYVIPKDWPNPFADITPGGSNHLCSMLGAGAFIDEYVWLPPLVPGEYEVVMDQYPFWLGQSAAFDPAVDLRGAYFTVVDAPIVYSVDPAAIKAAALDDYARAQAIVKTVQLIQAIKLAQSLAEAASSPAKLAYTLACEIEAVSAFCPQMPWEWTQGKALAMLGHAGAVLSQVYLDLYLDPPDPNFFEVVPIDLAGPAFADRPWYPPQATPFAEGMARIAQLAAGQAAAYRALVPTLEKLQGAQLAGDRLGLLIQSEKLIAQGELALAWGAELVAVADALEADLAGTLDETFEVAALKAELQSLVDDGPSPALVNGLRSFGLGNIEIAEVTLKASALNDGIDAIPNSFTYAFVLDLAREQHQSFQSDLVDLVAQATQIQNENEGMTLRTTPVITIAAVAPATVGDEVALSASATHFDAAATLAIAWDLDLDGAFDDASGESVTTTAVAPGFQLVSAQVTDSTGQRDVAHAWIEVTGGNGAPTITAYAPNDPAPYLEIDDTLELSISATDPDGDPLTITWLVDGTVVGSGEAYTFTMPDENVHAIEAVVADDDPFSPDTTARTVARAAKWQDPGTGGAGGEGGNGTGGNGGADPGVAPPPEASDGCGCRIAGAPSSHGFMALLLGLLLFRRRRLH